MANERVLITEDDTRIREMYAEMLTAAGYTIETARNGADALARLAQGGIDLLVLDLSFAAPEPREPDGFAVLQRVRSEAATKGLPVVVLTGTKGEPEHKKAAAELGVRHYLIKYKAKPKEVVETVRAALAAAATPAP